MFGAAFGTVAAQKGLTLAEAAAMSVFVFSGAAQMVAMEIWSNPITIGTILTLAASTLVVGLRMVLMGASLRPWLGALPPAQIYPPLLLNTDSTWLIAVRYREERRQRSLGVWSARDFRSGRSGRHRRSPAMRSET